MKAGLAKWTNVPGRLVVPDPRRVLAAHLPPKPISGRCVVVGGGKSAAVMAAALEETWPDVALEGTVVAITGAGSGIGRALALQVADHGAVLALSDRDSAEGLNDVP